MEIGEIKQRDTNIKLKDENIYVLDNMGDNLQGKLKRNALDNKKRATNIMQSFVINKLIKGKY